MRKSSKGALAAAAAAVLLMGGFGTHAAWTDDDQVPGGAINTGHLKLNSSCGDWDLVNTVLNTTTSILQADLADVLMVPGDVLSRLCTFTVDIKGDNLANATLTLDSAAAVKDGATTLTDLDASAVFTDDATGDPIASGATLTDGQVIKGKLSVKLPSTVTGLVGQDLSGVLNNLTVTVSQS